MTAFLLPASYIQRLLAHGLIERVQTENGRGPVLLTTYLDFPKTGITARLQLVQGLGFIASLWDPEPEAVWIPVEFDFSPGGEEDQEEKRREFCILKSREEVIDFIDYCLTLGRPIDPSRETRTKTAIPKIPPITAEDIQALYDSYQ